MITSEILNILALLWIILVLAYYLIPVVNGLPPTSTRPDRVRRALKLAGLQPGERLYDLGSGNGRVLVIAAREFRAKAVGIDVGPLQCLQGWWAARLNNVGSRVQLRWANFFKTDLREADVIFAYLTSSYAQRLEAVLQAQLKPGARVVTISFDLPDWEPADFDERDLIFLYRIPPTPGDLGTYLAKKI